ncbi:MAG: hypothetical protein WCT04_09415 [Planctomycetota bacterium]
MTKNSNNEEKAQQFVDGMTNEEVLSWAEFMTQPAPEIIESDLDQIISELGSAFDQGIIAGPIVAFGMIQGTHTQTVARVNVSPNDCLISLGEIEFEGRWDIEPHVARILAGKIGRQPGENMYPEKMFLNIKNDRNLVLEPYHAQIFSLPEYWFSLSRLREGLIRLLVTFDVNGETVEQECRFFSDPKLNTRLAHEAKHWVLE